MSAAELERVPLLAQLGAEERRALAEELERIEPEAGVQLFQEGDRADAALFVVAGRVRVRSERSGASAEFGPGAALGTLSLVADGRRQASAETASRCQIWRLRRSAYRRLVENAPGAACRLLEGVLRQHAQDLRDEIERESQPPLAGVA